MEKVKKVLLVTIGNQTVRRAVIALAVSILSVVVEYLNTVINGAEFNWAVVAGAVFAVVVKWVHSEVADVLGVVTEKTQV